MAPVFREQVNGSMDARSELLSVAALGSEGACRDARLCRDIRAPSGTCLTRWPSSTSIPARPAIPRSSAKSKCRSSATGCRPHTVHCGPEGIYVSALGNATGDGPGGIFLMDSESFEVLGRWEVDRGPQRLAYDAWWHLGYDTMVTSKWGTPNTVEDGLVPEILFGREIRTAPAFLGSAQAQAYAGNRFWSGLSARVRAQARA